MSETQIVEYTIGNIQYQINRVFHGTQTEQQILITELQKHRE